MKKKINTLIVEDNMLIQKHIEDMLNRDERFFVVGAVKDSFEAENICKEKNVDLILMDVQTYHNHSGLASGKRIKEHKKNIKIVVLTSLIDPDVLAVAKKGAADSLWYKEYSVEDLMDVIMKTMKGEHIFPITSPNVELNDMFSDDITPRQVEILRYYVKGLTYDEIASKLNITKSGVRWNLEQIMEKGGFNNKHELFAAVIENKFIVTTLKDEEE